MQRAILMFLIIGAAMIFFSCSENNSTAPELTQSDQVTNSLAKKPAPSLIGTTDVPFDISNWPFVWNGKIDFGGDIGELGLKFESHGFPRTYSQASPFYEEIYIYDLDDPDVVYLKGWNSGVVTNANRPPEPSQFLANGKIEEAYGPLEMWQGRNVHLRGDVIWTTDGSGFPERAVGTFRIN